MSEDTTQKLPNDDLKRILSIVESMDARLSSLEDKVDRRLQETRPIWEQVLVRMDKLEADFTEMRAEIRDGFETVSEKINVLGEDVISARARQKRLETRVSSLESELPQ